MINEGSDGAANDFDISIISCPFFLGNVLKGVVR